MSKTIKSVCKLLVPAEGKPCESYIKPGLCAREEYFRCIEYIHRFEPILSYSGTNSFTKCPRSYYYSNIIGLRKKEIFKTDALKIGVTVDSALGNNLNVELPAPTCEWEAKSQAIILMLKSDTLTGVRDIVSTGNSQLKFMLQEDGVPKVKGYIDFGMQDCFYELKCSSRPDYYTNKFWIHDQMGTYFLSNPNYQYGVLWCIRVPGLKRTGNFKDESFEDYRDRCVRDMTARPTYYFVGYKKDKKLFGIKFYRLEFDLEGLKAKYKWISKQIKQCVDADYWYQDRTQCISPWECDYMRICDTGGISEDMYEKSSVNR